MSRHLQDNQYGPPYTSKYETDSDGTVMDIYLRDSLTTQTTKFNSKQP